MVSQDIRTHRQDRAPRTQDVGLGLLDRIGSLEDHDDT